MVVPPASIMFTPLKVALETALATWSRMALKSSLRAVLEAVSRLVSEAAKAFSFICRSRSETASPPAMATSTVDCERCRESLTAFREPEVARWFWAMAQMAPLSFAEAIFLPVLMRFWTVISSELVWFRF